MIIDRSKDIIHEKWFKNIKESNILVKNSTFNVKVSDTKRNLRYSNGILVFSHIAEKRN